MSGQQQTAGSLAKRLAASSINEGLPVFRGLDDVTVAGKEIAAIAGVTAPTFSRWRAGQARIPERKLVFLTLLLAHWIDELECLLGSQSKQGRSKVKTKLNTTRRCLFQQEVINQTLPPETVREGSHLFRKWWFDEGEKKACGKMKKMKISAQAPRNESLSR